MSLAAEEQETKIIERVAAINGLRTNIRLYIKREKLHRLLKETRSASLFKEFSQSNFGTPTPPPSSAQENKWLRLPFLGKPTLLLEKEFTELDFIRSRNLLILFPQGSYPSYKKNLVSTPCVVAVVIRILAKPAARSKRDLKSITKLIFAG